jgi:glycosyltransferase involved in cell wall biosynthesis
VTPPVGSFQARSPRVHITIAPGRRSANRGTRGSPERVATLLRGRARDSRPNAVTDRTPVLFINSPLQAGADTAIQALLMRSIDRARFELHAASTPGKPAAPSPTFDLLAAIPDVRMRPTDFGPSLFGKDSFGKALGALQGVNALGSLTGLAAYIRSRGIRILHSSDRPRDAVPCVLLGKLTGAKSVVHLHVGMGDWMGRGVRWAFRNADALIGVSKFVARTIVDAGYAASRTHAVLNAMELEGWDWRLDPAPVRRELGLPASAPVLVTISRLFHWKGQGELVRALPAVRREFPDVRLVIVGRDDVSGAPERPSFTAELKALAAELGVAENVVFTGWRSDIPQLMAAADVFALPSFGEPFGLVYIEAMAMKRPVIALDSGGAPEVVEHGSSGLLAPPRDVEALTANILTLLRDPALRQRMGDSGRRRVEALFAPARLAADVERIYAGLTGG